MSFNNVKTLYFVKVLFSYLNQKRKLEIINYNKSLQNLLDINIINYKIFNGKYIEYESDGKAREYYYYNDNLVYEGEYYNGKRNGKGKEYDKYAEKIILYEGEYLNGKRNGKGKEYYFYTQNSKFEGEYLKGKKWNGKGYDDKNNIIYELKNGSGYIKEFGILGRLIYEGEYSNGQINGKGKEYDQEGNLEYEGEYKNGIRNGIGKEYYQDNLLFEGQYLDGKCGMEKHMIIKIIKYMN